MKIHRPLWNEGALLAPQQFQQQSEWDAFSRAGIAARGNAFPWGVGRVELDDAMLASGRVQAQSLRLWLPDDTLVDTRFSDLPPEPREIEAPASAGNAPVTVYVALPVMQAGIVNVQTDRVSAERPLRYRETWETVADRFSQEEESMAVARFNLAFRFGHEDNDAWDTCAIARLLQDGQLVMNDITPRKIKTGGDPRTLPDYAALRDELSKLKHPARPDVNWPYVEKRCLSLFEQNGVELQTAAWYTLARTQLAGLFGLNEGLAILDALISHQWGTLWPQPVHARMEILSSLSQRLQQRMRALPLNYSDLGQLYKAEQRLAAMGEVLQRLELKHLSQLDTLRILMHNSAVRLENSDDTTRAGAAVLPASVINDAAAFAADGAEETASAMKWVYVARPEYQANVEVLATLPAPVKKWKSFVAGMGAMLAISVAAAGSWQYVNRPNPLQAQLAASLAPLPATLTPEQMDLLRQQTALPQNVIARTQQQLNRLDKLPPGWSIDYSRQLVEQAQALWPEQAKSLAQQWQQQRSAAALPAEQLNGWSQGMMTLQKLSDRLNGLDEQKGKYITVSELKSVVFATMQFFNQSIPAEEQLRVLSQHPTGKPLPAAAQSQLEMHLKQLTARYAELKQQAEK